MSKVKHNYYIIRNDKDHNDIYIQHQFTADNKTTLYAYFRWHDPRLHGVKKTSFEHVPTVEMYMKSWKYILEGDVRSRCLAAFQIWNGLF